VDLDRGPRTAKPWIVTVDFHELGPSGGGPVHGLEWGPLRLSYSNRGQWTVDRGWSVEKRLVPG